MADALKEFYNARVIGGIAEDLQRAWPPFPAEEFRRAALSGLGPLSLLQRAEHIRDALRAALPEPFPEAARLLVAALGPAHASSESFGMEPFRYLPHASFIARYGLGHLEESLAALQEITTRFTAEWPIRAFLLHHYETTYTRLLEWTAHPNVHVRRLCSEGTRPRLPWATRLERFLRHPSPVLALLERLKDDPERYVQRSVANNLNDIAKDHPALVLATCARWLPEAPEGRAWIVRHALRSLVKQGNKEALALLGSAAAPAVVIQNATATPSPARIGGKLVLSCRLASTSDTSQALTVDYVVQYVKASGKTSPKVFKWKQLTLAPGEVQALSTTLSLRQMTTRTHYPGRHEVALQVNGVSFPLTSFVLVE